MAENADDLEQASCRKEHRGIGLSQSRRAQSRAAATIIRMKTYQEEDGSVSVRAAVALAGDSTTLLRLNTCGEPAAATRSIEPGADWRELGCAPTLSGGPAHAKIAEDIWRMAEAAAVTTRGGRRGSSSGGDTARSSSGGGSRPGSARSSHRALRRLTALTKPI